MKSQMSQAKRLLYIGLLSNVKRFLYIINFFLKKLHILERSSQIFSEVRKYLASGLIVWFKLKQLARSLVWFSLKRQVFWHSLIYIHLISCYKRQDNSTSPDCYHDKITSSLIINTGHELINFVRNRSWNRIWNSLINRQIQLHNVLGSLYQVM